MKLALFLGGLILDLCSKHQFIANIRKSSIEEQKLVVDEDPRDDLWITIIARIIQEIHHSFSHSMSGTHRFLALIAWLGHDPRGRLGD